MTRYQILFFLLIFNTTGLVGQSVIREVSLSDQSWRVWLDEKASWKEDTLYLPHEVNLQQIRVNPPGCGWNDLFQTGKTASLPVCVEELFSEGKPDWTYHGVSWFSSQFDVPADWKDKVVRLYIGKKNLRMDN